MYGWVGVLCPLGLSLPAGKWASACPDSLLEVARDGNEEVRKPFLLAVTSRRWSREVWAPARCALPSLGPVSQAVN